MKEFLNLLFPISHRYTVANFIKKYYSVKEQDKIVSETLASSPNQITISFRDGGIAVHSYQKRYQLSDLNMPTDHSQKKFYKPEVSIWENIDRNRTDKRTL